MPSKRKPVFSRRALARLEGGASRRARQIADDLLFLVKINAPYDAGGIEKDGRVRQRKTRGQHLRDAYYIEQVGKSAVLKCRRRYWAYVEFGTEEHGSAQPHVRPALAAVAQKYAGRRR